MGKAPSKAARGKAAVIHLYQSLQGRARAWWYTVPELTELLRRGGAVVTEKLVRDAMRQEKNGAVHKNKFGDVRYYCLEPKCGGAMTPVDARGKEAPRVAEHWLTSNAAMAVALGHVRDACVGEDPNMQREVRHQDRKSAAENCKTRLHSEQGSCLAPSS